MHQPKAVPYVSFQSSFVSLKIPTVFSEVAMYLHMYVFRLTLIRILCAKRGLTVYLAIVRPVIT